MEKNLYENLIERSTYYQTLKICNKIFYLNTRVLIIFFYIYLIFQTNTIVPFFHRVPQSQSEFLLIIYKELQFLFNHLCTSLRIEIITKNLIFT